MITIARLSSLDEAYRGMDLLHQHAIPPALAQDGELHAISVDNDFAPLAQSLLQNILIPTADERSAGPGHDGMGLIFEDDNT